MDRSKDIPPNRSLLKLNFAEHDSSVSGSSKAALALGAPIFEVANVRHHVADLAGGTFTLGAPSGHVEEVAGRTPEDFETIIGRYLAQPDLIYRG